MKISSVILSCLIIAVLAISASAQWVPLTGAPVPISSLPDRTLIFGDKKFSEIDVFGIGVGGAIAPTADSLLVQGGQNDGNYGLWFLLSWNAASGQSINADLNFKVSVLPGSDEYIKDVELVITGSSATGTGVVNVGETVWDAPFPDGDVIASLSASKQAGDDGAYLVAHKEFVPRKEIWIFSKDISITGGTNGSAHLSGLFQFYSQTQVPEPATVCLLSIGGLILLRRRRKKHL
ncbi:MAG: PEP-CTERM sorting domain-containing protein [Sedimentisphaerales bacterium]